MGRIEAKLLVPINYRHSVGGGPASDTPSPNERAAAECGDEDHEMASPSGVKPVCRPGLDPVPTGVPECPETIRKQIKN